VAGIVGRQYRRLLGGEQLSWPLALRGLGGFRQLHDPFVSKPGSARRAVSTNFSFFWRTFKGRRWRLCGPRCRVLAARVDIMMIPRAHRGRLYSHWLRGGGSRRATGKHQEFHWLLSFSAGSPNMLPVRVLPGVPV
jgi:hypothetical protein